METSSYLRVLALVLGGGAVLGMSLLAWEVQVTSRPRLGHRGAERRRAIEAGGAFAMLDPLVRFLAGVIALIPWHELRARQESELRRADHPWGLSPDELSALSLLGAIGLGIGGWFLSQQFFDSAMGAAVGMVLGALLPTFQLRELIRGRAKEISRGLPHAIEIVAMCMGAGHDFPGALRLVAAPQGRERSALSRELQVILEHLELGHTRRDALRSFAERVPTEAVRDFVNAVVQAEQRGNPLAKVIQVQGRMLNLRRSVLAEEAAARAAVLMVAPMLVLVMCVLLLLLGPFIVKGIGI